MFSGLNAQVWNEEWQPDSLGTYTLYGTVLNENGAPVSNASVILGNWKDSSGTTTDTHGDFALDFQVTRDQYAYNMQLHVRVLGPGSERELASYTIPVREFEDGVYTLSTEVAQTQPSQTVMAQQASPGKEQFLRRQLDSLMTVMQKYPERVDSLGQVIRDLRAQLDSIRSQPSQMATTGEDSGAGQRYVVKRGDSLSKIASQPVIYGDAEMWHTIYSSNREIIEDPDLIYPNQILVLPPQD